jgi:hypothetical protein
VREKVRTTPDILLWHAQPHKVGPGELLENVRRVLLHLPIGELGGPIFDLLLGMAEFEVQDSCSTFGAAR